jgi:hypothetical protein
MQELVDQRNAEIRDDRTRLEDKQRRIVADTTTPADRATAIAALTAHRDDMLAAAARTRQQRLQEPVDTESYRIAATAAATDAAAYSSFMDKWISMDRAGRWSSLTDPKGAIGRYWGTAYSHLADPRALTGIEIPDIVPPQTRDFDEVTHAPIILPDN